MGAQGIATVFGGSGFIGRYLVGRLAQAGWRVRVATRDPRGAAFLQTAGRVGQVVPMYAAPNEPGTLAQAAAGADLVANLVGIVSERRRGDFARINAELPGRLAALAAANGARYVYLSGIGADAGAASGAARSKAEGEQAVRRALPSACILRPSVVFGVEDRFFNPLARAIQLLPFAPVVMGAVAVQPVYVGDVADAAMAGLTRDDAAGGVYELGGPRVWTLREITAWVVACTRRNRPLVPMPAWMGLSRDQRLLLARGNVVSPGAYGLSALGVVPTPVDLVVPNYLAQYAPGGGAVFVPAPSA